MSKQIEQTKNNIHFLLDLNRTRVTDVLKSCGRVFDAALFVCFKMYLRKKLYKRTQDVELTFCLGSSKI